MNIHWLQHVEFEGLGSIQDWAVSRGHHLSCSRLFSGESLPKQDSVEMLIIMGGPMGVYDHQEHPWLVGEKDFIGQTIHQNKPVLGICLGAQLIGDVLGARVFANREKEIGWFPLVREQNCPEPFDSLLPKNPTVFQWHGDTFDLPAESTRLYSSEACLNQAFLYQDRVLGLQFHLETTPESRKQLVANCGNELVQAPWIQPEETILAKQDHFQVINRVMNDILDYLVDCAMVS